MKDPAPLPPKDNRQRPPTVKKNLLIDVDEDTITRELEALGFDHDPQNLATYEKPDGSNNPSVKKARTSKTSTNTRGRLPPQSRNANFNHTQGIIQERGEGLRLEKTPSQRALSQFRANEKKLKDLNKEPDYLENSSLMDRANRMVGTDDYLHKVKMIKGGNTQIKSMEFIMDGIKIELPYNGQKVTQGYLKKETKAVSLLMNRNFQMRYCILDLTKFVFRYAKAPTDKYTFIQLKDIIDIILERDPKPSKKPNTGNAILNVMSNNAKKQEEEGFNMIIKTQNRRYRMQANTKAEQIMWARAFTILFELRARVSQDLKTTI